MQYLVGMFALTLGARRACDDQANEWASLGLFGPAMVLTVWKEIAFAPVIAAQELVIEKIAVSASSFD